MQKVRFSMADLVVATVPLAAVLARPQAADAAKISTRLYMPTMLLKDSMPAGLTDLESVPTLRATNADDDFEARLSEYVRGIRATSAVFAVANHKEKTLAQDQGNMLWINCNCVIVGWFRVGRCGKRAGWLGWPVVGWPGVHENCASMGIWWSRRCRSRRCWRGRRRRTRPR